MSLAGFHNTSVSKGILMVGGAASFASFYFKKADLFSLSFTSLTGSLQLWRLITHNIVFSTPSEFVLGAVLLYHLRLLERHYGSSKFASFAITTSALTTLLQVGALVTLNVSGIHTVFSGFYGLIFAAIVQYYKDVPTTDPISFLGLQLSGKSVVYGLALQLLFLAPPASFISGVCGIIAGILYRTDLGNVQSFKLPEFVLRCFRNYVDPWFSSADSRNARSRTTRRGVPRSAIRSPFFPAHEIPRQTTSSVTSAPPPPRPVTPPSEEAISQLTSMGFTREAVVQALSASGNDINRATNRLLDS